MTKEFSYSTTDPYFFNQCKPSQTVVTAQRPSQPAYVRTTAYTYTATGQPATTVIDPGTAHQNTLTYTYDPAFGNLIQEDRVAGTSSTRTFSYSADGKFLTQATDELGHSVYTTYDKWGNLLSSKDINSQVNTYTYDYLNRQITATSATGITTLSSYYWAASLSSCPPTGTFPNYAVETSVTGITGSNITYFDVVGRQIRSIVPGYDGAPIYQDITYNANNSIQTSTDPYLAGATPLVTTYNYDQYNRITQTIRPENTITTSYVPISTGGVLAGMKITATNISATPTRSKESTIDGTGKPELVTEGGSQIGYLYHSNGKMARTVVNSEFVTQYTYDSYGNLLNEASPNKNATTYVYDARDQLLKSTDANSNVLTYTYDLAGRIHTKTSSEGVYNYTYGTTPYTYGRLVHQDAPATMSTDYTYDYFSRLIQTDENISGSVFTTQYAYDDYSRVTNTTYPNGNQVGTEYSVYGYFQGLNTTAGSTGYPAPVSNIYTRTGVNPYGNTTNAEIGPISSYSSLYYENNTYNSHGFLSNTKVTDNVGTILNKYTYNFEESTGDLISKTDDKWNLTENFTYDVLDRLTSAQQSYALPGGGVIATQLFDYGLSGNIMHKSDVSTEPWQYNKYAVTAIPNPSAVIPSFVQTAAYNPLNKVKVLTENDKKVVFTYRPDGNRGMAQYYTAGVLTKTRYYASNFERTVDAATGLVQEICYVLTPEDKLVSMLVTDAGTTRTKYVVTDYLSSITHILNDAGGIDEERSYDAWGRLRNPTSWTYTAPSYAYDRGYTCEELLKDFNVINLNGRLYDPLIGKMFSVDPVVADHTDAQSYNSYSYARNNPLKYNDRSGEVAEVGLVVAAVVAGGLLNLGMELAHGKVHSFGDGVSAFCIGATATVVVIVAVAGGPTTMAAAIGGGEGTAALIGGGIGGGIGGSITFVGNAAALDDYDHNKPIDQQFFNATGLSILTGGALGWGIYQLNSFGSSAIPRSGMNALSNEGSEASPVNPEQTNTNVGQTSSTSIEPEHIGVNDERNIFTAHDGCSNLESAYITAKAPTAAETSTPFGESVLKTTTRVGKNGNAVEVLFKNGSKMDINAARVKEWVPNQHPNAPVGTLQKVKFDNFLPGSKGFKRTPTQGEIDFLNSLFK